MSARLFAALDLPDGIVAALDAFAATVERDGLRRVPVSSLHVTLAFLGHRPDEEVEAIAGAVLGSAAPVPGLVLGDPAWLPARRPRVLAVDIADTTGACGRLQSDVAAALTAIGAYAPERRSFRPHVTVARVRRGAVVDAAVPRAPEPMAFAARALTLYRSHLGPGGARYAPVARAELA